MTASKDVVKTQFIVPMNLSDLHIKYAAQQSIFWKFILDPSKKALKTSAHIY